MSQASKYVEWCLNKAQKEVKDEAKLNELKDICRELMDITKEIIYQ